MMKVDKQLGLISKENDYEFTNDVLEKLYRILDIIVENSDSSENFTLVNGKITYFHQIVFSKLSTLKTIDFCLKNNSITDAYTLLRKYRDDLFLYIYLLLINQKQRDIQFDKSETRKKIENEIESFESWMIGLIGKREYIDIKKKNFEFKIYINKIRKINKEIEYLFQKFFPKKLNKMGRLLNNYVHSNGLYFVINGLLYDNIKRMEQFIETIVDVTVIFMSCLSLINSYCFRSDDYLFDREMNILPLPDSQYWIAPVLSEFLKQYFSKELLEYLNENNSHKMMLIEDNNKQDVK